MYMPRFGIMVAEYERDAHQDPGSNRGHDRASLQSAVASDNH